MLTNFWEELTTNEIKKINRKTVLIFPFSSIEQHGPHLPLNTDKKILEGILLEFNKKYNSNKYLIMPEIYFGSADEHTDFEGTISIDSLEFISHSLSILENVCKLKFKNILLLNSHGGQISHIDIIAKELKSEFNINIVKGTYFLFDVTSKICFFILKAGGKPSTKFSPGKLVEHATSKSISFYFAKN